MAKYPLVGPSFVGRSLAFAASENTNLIIELIESAVDRAKNVAIAYIIPGRQSKADLNSGVHGIIRGLWSGGGRLFVAQGEDLVEVAEDGSVVSRHTYDTINDGTPVQIFGSGRQLLVIASGQAYCDNGAGPVVCRFLITGSVTAVGAAITWESGDEFPPAILNRSINIDGVDHLVTVYTDATHITLDTPVGGSAASVVNVWADGQVYCVSGDTFTSEMVGQFVNIDGKEYKVISISSDRVINIDGWTGDTVSGLNFTWAATGLRYTSPSGDIVTAVTGAYLNNTFYVQRPTPSSPSDPDIGRQVNFSAVDNAESWDPLDFKTKEGAADHIRGILADTEVLHILGVESLEHWVNDPSTGELVRLPGTTQKFGCISPWAPAAINGKVYFLGGDAQGGPVAYRIDGSTPIRISTHAEEAHWREQGFGLNCVAYTYMEDGHVFWVVQFGAEAWCWDETTQLWHRRMAWNDAFGGFISYQTTFHTYLQEWNTGNGMHVTAQGDGFLYESSLSIYDDAGADIAWRRAIPYRYADGNRIYFGRMTLEMEMGTAASFTISAAAAGNPTVLTKVAHGLQNGNAVAFTGATGNWTPLNGTPFIVTVLTADTFSIPLNSTGFGALTGTVKLCPVITLDYSDDRGNTYVNPRYAGVGIHDDKSVRGFWTRNGQSRGRSWRLFGRGKHKTVLIDLECDETAGTG